jgi:hypothetical protein
MDNPAFDKGQKRNHQHNDQNEKKFALAPFAFFFRKRGFSFKFGSFHSTVKG